MAAPASAAHDCDVCNPCAQENTYPRQIYFIHDDITKFVWCTEWKQCLVMSCPYGLIWIQEISTCD